MALFAKCVLFPCIVVHTRSGQKSLQHTTFAKQCHRKVPTHQKYSCFSSTENILPPKRQFFLSSVSNQQISTKKSACYIITRSDKQVHFINKQLRKNSNVAYLPSLFTQNYFSKGSDNHNYPIKGVFTTL